MNARNQPVGFTTAPPEVSPKRDWTETQHCRWRHDETRPDFSEHVNKTSRQHSDLSPDNFNNHRNYPFLELPFLEGLDEEFVILVEQHQLNWPTMHANQLAVLAGQLSKLFKRRKRMELLKS